MTFSLILATLGDADGLARFLDGLRGQSGVACELIIVDQNDDDRVGAMIRHAGLKLAIRHVRTRPGLSSARNVGIAIASGDILAFPDDDCWYPAGLLVSVEHMLNGPDVDGLTCRCTDEAGRLAAGGDDRRSGLVTKGNVWRRGVSATMFLKRATIDAVGQFDESLGLGSTGVFQSGEETDYLLRCIAQGRRIRYRADLTVHHPPPPDCRLSSAVAKAYAYGLGMGRVLRMHDYTGPEVAWHVAMPFIGAALAAACGNLALARVRVARGAGRFQGWSRRARVAATVRASGLRVSER